jgi:hypothetical protein
MKNQNSSKLSAGLEDTHSNKLVGNRRPTFLLSSNPSIVSTYQGLPTILQNKLTNQKQDRGVKRKGNWTTDQGGLLTLFRPGFKNHFSGRGVGGGG